MGRGFWAGLDVGVETTSIAVINDQGEILQEAACRTDVCSIHRQLRWLRRRRQASISLEAATGVAIARGLRSRGYSVQLYETRQLSKFLRARRNKTDAGDALGIAEAARIGATIIATVHLKSLECQTLQSRLAIRRHLIRQRIASTSLLCRQIEQYGGRVLHDKTFARFRKHAEAQIRALFGRNVTPLVLELRHLLDHCEQLASRQRVCDRELTRLASGIDICRRFMEIPGVGPICALTFYAVVGEPSRFRRSADVGAYLGLTPRLHQSGLSSRTTGISHMGNSVARGLLTHASSIFMRSKHPTGALGEWAKAVTLRRGRGRARVALARKLAVLMVAMWKKDESFRPEPSQGPAPPSPRGEESEPRLFQSAA